MVCDFGGCGLCDLDLLVLGLCDLGLQVRDLDFCDLILAGFRQ